MAMSDHGKSLGGPLSEEKLYAFSRLPAHLADAGQSERLYVLLTDFWFLEQKAALNPQEHLNLINITTKIYPGVFRLQEDFRSMLQLIRKSPLADSRQEVIRAFDQVIRQDAYFLSEHPELLWQQLCSRLQWASASVAQILAQERERRERCSTRPWLYFKTPNRESPALVRNLIHQITPRRNRITGCGISSGSTWVVTVSEEGSLKVWDVQTGEERVSLACAYGSCALSYDTTRFATASTLAITLWDTESWEIERTFNSPFQTEAEDKYIRACAISPDNSLIVAATNENLMIWNTDKDQEPCILSENEMGSICCCTFSPDGTFLVSGDDLGQLRLRDAKTWEIIRTINSSGWSGVEIQSCAVSPDSAWIATVGARRTLRIREVATGRDRFTPTNIPSLEYFGPRDCTFSADGHFVITVGPDNGVRIWDATTGKERTNLSGHHAPVSACACNQRYLVSGDFSGAVKVWDFQACLQQPTPSIGHRSNINACAISPKGDFFVTASSDQTLKIWDMTTGQQLHTLKDHEDEINTCAVSPDGRFIVSGDEDSNRRNRSLRIWKKARTLWKSQWKPQTLQIDTSGHDYNTVITCAVSPDGKTIVTSNWFYLNLLKAPNWKVRKTLRDPSTGTCTINTCAFSPDGTWIVSGGDEGNLIVWDAVTGHQRRTLDVREDIASCAISPDG
jgi:WD40 repeat protein